jgi:hypothetical protein
VKDLFLEINFPVALLCVKDAYFPNSFYIPVIVYSIYRYLQNVIGDIVINSGPCESLDSAKLEPCPKHFFMDIYIYIYI